MQQEVQEMTCIKKALQKPETLQCKRNEKSQQKETSTRGKHTHDVLAENQGNYKLQN